MITKYKVGFKAGKFPFKIEKHAIVNDNPVCKPNDKGRWLILSDPTWKVTCKNCKKRIK
jgi:hypothetical protein